MALKSVTLFGGGMAPVNDAALRSLASAKGLNSLSFYSLEITERYLGEVAQLPALASLGLEQVRLPGSGLAALQGAKVNRVTSRYTDKLFDDAALQSLIPVKSVKTVELAPNSLVTEAGIAAFQKARPDVQVTRAK